MDFRRIRATVVCLLLVYGLFLGTAQAQQPEFEEQLLFIDRVHPSFGGNKIGFRLDNQGHVSQMRYPGKAWISVVVGAAPENADEILQSIRNGALDRWLAEYNADLTVIQDELDDPQKLGWNVLTPTEGSLSIVIEGGGTIFIKLEPRGGTKLEPLHAALLGELPRPPMSIETAGADNFAFEVIGASGLEIEMVGFDERGAEVFRMEAFPVQNADDEQVLYRSLVKGVIVRISRIAKLCAETLDGASVCNDQPIDDRGTYTVSGDLQSSTTEASIDGELSVPVIPAWEPRLMVQNPPLAVRCVQTSLNTLGFDAGPADGLMGARTRSAAADWQTESGLNWPPLNPNTAYGWCRALEAEHTELAGTPINVFLENFPHEDAIIIAEMTPSELNQFISDIGLRGRSYLISELANLALLDPMKFTVQGYDRPVFFLINEQLRNGDKITTDWSFRTNSGAQWFTESYDEEISNEDSVEPFLVVRNAFASVSGEFRFRVFRNGHLLKERFVRVEG